MKLILVMVTSLDGRSTWEEKEGTHEWNSEEDQRHFQKVIENGHLLIMGSTTFAGALKSMNHTKNRLRVILTKHPEKYENEKITGKLEFTNKSPAELINFKALSLLLLISICCKSRPQKLLLPGIFPIVSCLA